MPLALCVCKCKGSSARLTCAVWEARREGERRVGVGGRRGGNQINPKPFDSTWDKVNLKPERPQPQTKASLMLTCMHEPRLPTANHSRDARQREEARGVCPPFVCDREKWCWKNEKGKHLRMWLWVSLPSWKWLRRMQIQARPNCGQSAVCALCVCACVYVCQSKREWTGERWQNECGMVDTSSAFVFVWYCSFSLVAFSCPWQHSCTWLLWLLRAALVTRHTTVINDQEPESRARVALYLA